MANDLISRQAAIDALNSLQKFNLIDSNGSLHGVGVRLKFAVQKLEQLPSAEPEIIRCKDCKHRQEDECPMYHVEWVEYDDDGYIESDDVIYDYTEDDGYCHMAERRTDEQT